MIARKLYGDTNSERFEVDERIQELKELTRYQNRIIQARSKNKTLYVRLLDIMFPEFAKIVGNVHNNYVYDLLTSYPTPRHYDQQIDEIQSQINELLNLIDSPILSITGIGNRLGAIILAETKNIDNFSSPAQLQAFAGLDPSIYQSGQMDNSGRMVKRGSHYLRYALMMAAESICRYSPHFKAYLALKRSQGKHYYVAVSHAAKKLIRVIYHLLKTNQTFDETKLR